MLRDLVSSRITTNFLFLRRNASKADVLIIARCHRCRRRTTNAQSHPQVAEDVVFLFHVRCHRTGVNKTAPYGAATAAFPSVKRALLQGRLSQVGKGLIFMFALSHVHTTGRVCSPFTGRRFSIRLHLHWRNCFSTALLTEGASRYSASHVPTCIHKCNQSQQTKATVTYPTAAEANHAS
jgi:hypothetical protein